MLLLGLYSLLLQGANPPEGKYDEWRELLQGNYINVCLNFAFVVATGPAIRSKIHASLGRLTQTKEERGAAAVAALVGRMNRSRVMSLATNRFRVLPWRVLTLDHFATNADSGLNLLTESAPLGACDAFISHSWHDNAGQKWKALTVWAADFTQRFGRGPTVWLDKACIDQSNIEESLAALPVFLAGCSHLVVVAGPTYASRLWCVIELYTFLRMGGSLDRVTVLPIGAERREDVVRA